MIACWILCALFLFSPRVQFNFRILDVIISAAVRVRFTSPGALLFSHRKNAELKLCYHKLCHRHWNLLNFDHHDEALPERRRGRSTEKNWSLSNFTKVSHKRSQVDGEIHCAFIHIQHTLKCKESLQRQNKKIIKVQRRRRQWRTGISYSREHRARAE